MSNNLKELQDAFGRTFRLHTGGVVKIGKVIGATRGRNLIDVAFLDSGTVQNVVVVSSYAASESGIAGLLAPSVDLEALPRKTYPPGFTTQLGANVRDPSTIQAGDPHRDIYAVCLPCEGGDNLTAGWVAVGFIFPAVSEMLFDVGDDKRFTDHYLFRHGSDVQITMDRNATLSLQHPSGARLSIGDINATPAEGKSNDIRTDPVDLTEQDYDHLYRLRNNQTQQPSVVLEDVNGNKITLDGRDNKITVEHSGGSVITLEGNKITIAAPDKIDITASSQITVSAPIVLIGSIV